MGVLTICALKHFRCTVFTRMIFITKWTDYMFLSTICGLMAIFPTLKTPQHTYVLIDWITIPIKKHSFITLQNSKDIYRDF